ncbi:MAG TPA: S41 family peptidase [Gracilimonas sp.]|uniref:S41 family peptidase n=1 Tax=Gracilimonas sp. TaxID=1974203 RepID=UPI002DA595F5|nr:S41 family peptidase [Gracilimonas sp.]
MTKRTLSFFVFALSIIFVVSACKSNPSGSDDGEYSQVNNWVLANMDFYYFWNELVPEEADGNQQPEDFFTGMLEPNDAFSYISDDAETLLDELNGSSFTAGFSPAFGLFSGTENVFIIVEFVYPNTPAAAAGIERGDIIIRINDQDLTTDNYLDLYYDDSSAKYTFGIYNVEENSISEGGSVTVNKAELSLDPVVYTDIIEDSGHKIGYIFYSRFINGENDQFIQAVDNVLADFENQGVTELIVDLRYNPGGTIDAAENLANSIAPQSVTTNEEVFVQYEYNETLEQYYIDNEGLDSPNLISRFSEDPTNLNLDRVYFLGTSSSASASELLINGLRPYMDVVLVGTPTFGKFYGSYVLTGLNSNPPNNYAIVPVVLKYANAVGFSDFGDGLAPDHVVEEDLFQSKPLGDPTDELLSKALELITGTQTPPRKNDTKYSFYKIGRSNKV